MKIKIKTKRIWGCLTVASEDDFNLKNFENLVTAFIFWNDCYMKEKKTTCTGLLDHE